MHKSSNRSEKSYEGIYIMISMRSITTAVAAVLLSVGLSACGGNDPTDATDTHSFSPPGDIFRDAQPEVVDLNKLMYHPKHPNCAGTSPITLDCVKTAEDGLVVILSGTVSHIRSVEERKSQLAPFPQHIGDEVVVNVKGNESWPMALPLICPVSIPGCTDVKAGDTVGINAKYQLHHSAYTGLRDQLDPFVVSIAIH